VGKPWLVFGGWAISPEILKPLFGDESFYVDINKIMPLLFDGGELNLNWTGIIKKMNECLAIDVAGIVGWSTGAIIACALTQYVTVKRLVLFSATPSFCRREGFKYGMRATVIRSMISKLQEKNDGVVKDFLIQCGLNDDETKNSRYDDQTLIKGLMFLEQVNLIGALKKLECACLVIHGRDDKIIPSHAGETLAGMIGAECKLVDGGHAFFANRVDETKRMIG